MGASLELLRTQNVKSPETHIHVYIHAQDIQFRKDWDISEEARNGIPHVLHFTN